MATQHIACPYGPTEIVADFEDESYYVVLPELLLFEELDWLFEELDHLGLEMMTEDECPAEPMLDGGALVWCALIDGGAEW